MRVRSAEGLLHVLQWEGKMTDFENSIEQELDFEKLTELCDNLKEAVREILNSCGMYFRIFSRVKSPNSIAEKLLRGQYGTEQNPKKLQDLVGLRVVLYYYDDLSICRDIMESTFQMVDDWSRPKYNADEFKATKINGVFRFPEEFFNVYKKELWNLPIDTTFEIQFRTVFFEGWHEIEHDMRYKSLLSDKEFWKGSEELSRILNCILANLELSDWSLVQLFEELSYNHYKNRDWEIMLKCKYRIKMADSEPLDPKILAVFDQDKEIAKKFFKGSRKTLIKELLKLESPHINYNLIVKLMNNKEIHDPQIAAICQNIPINQDERTYQKNTLARLESSILFHLERPLLHKNTRKLESEFYNAALIVYKWARFKLNPVFEDIPAELSTYRNHLPGYKLKIFYDEENLSFSMKMNYIDSQSIGTFWHVHTSIAKMDDGLLHFYHVTSRDVPRGISQRSTFTKPSFLADLSNKVGIMDIVRLGSKAHFVNNTELLHELYQLTESNERMLPVIVIAQNSPNTDAPQETVDYRDYDMNTFTINGTRLAKVVGHYSHVYMLDYHFIEDFAAHYAFEPEKTIGCICIFRPSYQKKERMFFTRKMVMETQFDFNRFAFHEEDIYEKAFRHNLVQLLKDDNTNH